MRFALLWILILTVFVISAIQSSEAGDPEVETAAMSKNGPSRRQKKKSTDWSKVDMNALEKKWEDGDEEEELEHEYERNKKIAAKKAKSGPAFNPNDPESMKRYMKQNKASIGMNSNDGGPSMVFVELTPKLPSGEKWTKDRREHISGKWTTLLKTGSVDAELYDIGDTSLLLNIKKGWLVADAIKFILNQPEVVKVTKDSRDIFLKDLADDNYDEDL